MHRVLRFLKIFVYHTRNNDDRAHWTSVLYNYRFADTGRHIVDSSSVYALERSFLQLLQVQEHLEEYAAPHFCDQLFAASWLVQEQEHPIDVL